MLRTVFYLVAGELLCTKPALLLEGCFLVKFSNHLHGICLEASRTDPQKLSIALDASYQGGESDHRGAPDLWCRFPRKNTHLKVRIIIRLSLTLDCCAVTLRRAGVRPKINLCRFFTGLIFCCKKRSVSVIVSLRRDPQLIKLTAKQTIRYLDWDFIGLQETR